MAIKNLEFKKGNSFEDIFALKGVRVTELSNTTASSTIVSGLLRTDLLSEGMLVTGAGIPTLTTIATIVNTNTITISAPATVTANDVSILYSSSGYVDIQAMNFRGHIRTTATSPTIQAAFGFVKNIDNTVKMFLTPTQTAPMAGNNFVYDIEMYSNDELFVSTIMSGEIIAHDEITR